MTEFRKLAERIAEDIWGVKSTSMFGQWYLCESDMPKKLIKYIEKYFRPTFSETEEYQMYQTAWLANRNETRAYNNSFRILILLMAEQHYLTYNKS